MHAAADSSGTVDRRHTALHAASSLVAPSSTLTEVVAVSKECAKETNKNAMETNTTDIYNKCPSNGHLLPVCLSVDSRPRFPAKLSATYQCTTYHVQQYSQEPIKHSTRSTSTTTDVYGRGMKPERSTRFYVGSCDLYDLTILRSFAIVVRSCDLAIYAAVSKQRHASRAQRTPNLRGDCLNVKASIACRASFAGADREIRDREYDGRSPRLEWVFDGRPSAGNFYHRWIVHAVGGGCFAAKFEYRLLTFFCTMYVVMPCRRCSIRRLCLLCGRVVPAGIEADREGSSD